MPTHSIFPVEIIKYKCPAVCLRHIMPPVSAAAALSSSSSVAAFKAAAASEPVTTKHQKPQHIVLNVLEEYKFFD